MDVLQAIASRRSHRAYQAEQLPEEVLEKILKAGLEAPSARNHQPWHFAVVQDPAVIQAVHDEAAAVMGKGGSPRFADEQFQIFYHAPTVVFIFGEKAFDWHILLRRVRIPPAPGRRGSGNHEMDGPHRRSPEQPGALPRPGRGPEGDLACRYGQLGVRGGKRSGLALPGLRAR